MPQAVPSASVAEALPIGFHLLQERLEAITRSDVDFLQDAARRLLGSGGKRLRPRLVFVGFLALGGEPFPAPVIEAATAIELVHTASLVHDDILDDADLRRGAPTVHRQLGTPRALLVGDFLFARVLDALNGLPEDVRTAILNAGTDLCEGEALELELTRKGASTLEQYFTVIAKKTASLLEASAYAGARLAGAKPAEAAHMADFGFHAGIAFQLVDDLLDVEGVTEVTGKPVGLDLAHGVPNAALLVALESRLRRGRRLVPLPQARDQAPQATLDLVRGSKAPRRVHELAQMYASRALESLQALPPTPARRDLETFVRLTVERDR